MKICRLKIISSNIIDDIDTPKIHYISKNVNINFLDKINISNNQSENNNNNNNNNINNNSFNSNEKKLSDKKEENKEENKENITDENNENNAVVKQIQLEELIKYDFIDNNKNTETYNLKSKKENENENENKNINSFDNKDENENNNNKDIDINDLCTVSNQHLYEEDKNDLSNNNFNTMTSFNNTNNNNNNTNYPYNIESKKKELNNSLRYVFKKRDKKPYMNRSLSYMNNNKKNSLIKNIVTTNTINANNINKKNYKNNNINKSGSILNININKSFCLNNNLNNYNKNKTVKLKNNSKSRNKNNNSNLRYNSKNSNNSTNSKNKKKMYNSNIMKKVKPLKIKKYNFDDSQSSSFISWNIIEKNDFNIQHNIDYKLLIDNLLIKECQLIQEKENIIKIYEDKLKPLRELNIKLMDENNEELNREDELKGELTVLKNQYEKLFSLLDSDKIKDNIIEPCIVNDNNLNNIKNNKYKEEYNDKIKEIDQKIKELNDNLKKGEILLITKPTQYEKISEQDDEKITLMLKGIFISQHILNTDKVVDLIWKYDKQFQFLNFLVDELIDFFNLDPNSDKNILLNYFYLICENYNYMNIDTFKIEFHNKIGVLEIYSKYLYISKLLHYYKTQIIQLMQILKEKDVFGLGIIKYEQLRQALKDLGLNFHTEKTQDLFRFLIFCMKKDRRLDLSKNNKDNNNEIKYSLFDLFYGSFIDFINEYNCNIIKNPFKLIRDYMKKKDINNAEYILRPLLTQKYILKVNNIEYIDIIILNKYLRKIGIIDNDNGIWFSTFEEELIDKNKFINEIYNSNDNIKEENNIEKINRISDNFIDDIFKTIK